MEHWSCFALLWPIIWDLVMVGNWIIDRVDAPSDGRGGLPEE